MLGITDAVELTRKIGDLVKAGATLGLQETITELREAVLNAKEEVLRLREENQTLNAKLAFAGSMKYQAPYYINVGGGDRGPYCGTCWDAERLAIHLIERQRGYWQCRRCEDQVEDSTAEDPPDVVPYE